MHRVIHVSERPKPQPCHQTYFSRLSSSRNLLYGSFAVSRDRTMCCGKTVSAEALTEAGKVTESIERLRGILKIPV